MILLCKAKMQYPLTVKWADTAFDFHGNMRVNPFNPESTIVILIHYKPRIAVAILDLQWMKMIWSGW